MLFSCAAWADEPVEAGADAVDGALLGVLGEPDVPELPHPASRKARAVNPANAHPRLRIASLRSLGE
jgi:hypothetical protein